MSHTKGGVSEGGGAPLLGLKEFRCYSTSSLTLTEPNKNDNHLTFPEVPAQKCGSRQGARMVWMTPNAVHPCPSTCFPVFQIHICYAGQYVQRGHLSSPKFCPVKVAAGSASISAVFQFENSSLVLSPLYDTPFFPSLLTGPSVSILTLRHTFPPVASHVQLS